MSSVEELLHKLRTGGWSLAVHNDYKLGRERYTFYLFTHISGIWAKGEGPNDSVALALVIEDAEIRMDSLRKILPEGNLKGF